jgi:4,5-dihydroxyphthalate decarboxylase
MMAAGELQAGFTGNAGLGRTGAPKEGWAAGAAKPAETNYVEFFKDSRKLEADWYRRTGIYPFHGTIVVKDSVLKEHPWVAQSLFKAFTAAKEPYVRELPSPDKASGKDRQLAELATVVGDPLPYGIAKNRASIEALIKYVHQQGMLKKSYAVSDFFVDPEAA